MTKQSIAIKVKDLTVAYGDFVLLKDLTFDVRQGEIFIIMGGSGCGKSSLLRILTGLMPASKGYAFVNGTDMVHATPADKNKVMRQCGILYQGGALFSSMTLGENVALPMKLYTRYSDKEIAELVALKLALVGLDGFQDFYPSEISGGMKKRAGLARALALDPDILYFDEPSAGLDPVASRHLDDLILNINQSLGTTIVVVTHELSSIFAIGQDSIFLDKAIRGIGARGKPSTLLKNPPNKTVYQFLTRGGKSDENTQ